METLDDPYYEHLNEGADIVTPSVEVNQEKLLIASLQKELNIAQNMLQHANRTLDHMRFREDKHLVEIRKWKKRWYDEYVKTHEVVEATLLEKLYHANFDGV
jgi:hypothetical protein